MARPSQDTDNSSNDEHWIAKASRMLSDRGARMTRALSYGDHPRWRYDLYEPPEGIATVATAQFIYGGSWQTGERGCYQHIGAALAVRGIRTVIADYRLHPDVSFPSFVEDMARAYNQILTAHCGATPPPVVIGHSAGAHIGGLLCGDRRYLDAIGASRDRATAYVGISGPYTFDPITWDTTKHIFTTAAGAPNEARPIAFASCDFPPTLLIHGARDKSVTPNASQSMHAALLDAGVRSELKIYPHLAHAGPVAVIAKPMRWLAPVLKSISTFVIAESARGRTAKTE